MLIGALLGTGLMAPAQAAGTTQVDGSGYYDDITGDECDAPPSEFSDYPALVLHGDLEGCLYAHVLSGKFTPSGVWIETGQELVVASLNRRAGRNVHDQLPVRGQVRGGLHRRDPRTLSAPDRGRLGDRRVRGR